MKFSTEVNNGIGSIKGCYFEKEEGKSPLIVKKGDKYGDNTVFAFQIDWDSRTIIPCYAEYDYDVVLEEDVLVKIKGDDF